VVGVGLVLNHTSRRGRNGLFVQELADGPARNSGMIAPGDQLLSVDRHNVETSRIEDLSYLLPGPEGSEVRVPTMLLLPPRREARADACTDAHVCARERGDYLTRRAVDVAGRLF
jgi:hypothetical protein